MRCLRLLLGCYHAGIMAECRNRRRRSLGVKSNRVIESRMGISTSIYVYKLYPTLTPVIDEAYAWESLSLVSTSGVPR
jgi:hypothetical protein